MIKSRILYVWVAAALCCGCSALSKVNWNYDSLASAGAKALTAASITEAQVAALCREAVGYADSQTPLAPDSYQQRLQKLMAGAARIDGTSFNFKVYKSGEINACAYGDGSVRVNSALMDVMDDDELTAVIGHELGHVVHKDSMKAMKQAYLTSAARDAVSAAGSYGQLAGIVLGDVSEAFVSAQYSQSQESKADDYGFQFAVDSGRDAYSMCRALEKLSDLSGGSQASAVARMFSSHPDSAKRAAKMRAKADEYTKRK